MTAVRVEVVSIRCDDCGIESEVEAEIHGGAAYWVCPTTWCDRTFIDPSKITDVDAATETAAAVDPVDLDVAAKGPEDVTL